MTLQAGPRVRLELDATRRRAILERIFLAVVGFPRGRVRLGRR